MRLLWERFQPKVNATRLYSALPDHGDSDLLSRHSKLSCVAVKQSKTRSRSACDPCVKAKFRCSSSVPCTRWRNKGIPCLKDSTKSSTDEVKVDDAIWEISPRTTQSASMQEPELLQNHDHEKMGPDPSVFTHTIPSTTHHR